MTDQQQTTLILQDDAIRSAEKVLRCPTSGRRGHRADLASDAFWLLTTAIHQSCAHLKASFRCERESDGDLAAEAVAGGLQRCLEMRSKVLKHF